MSRHPSSPQAEAKARAVARARRRALDLLVEAHRTEFEVLLHAEKHAANIGHAHGPDSPETVAWWGDGDGSGPG